MTVHANFTKTLGFLENIDCASKWLSQFKKKITNSKCWKTYFLPFTSIKLILPKFKKPAGASPRYELRVSAQEILSRYLDSCRVIHKKTSEWHVIRNGGLHVLLQKDFQRFNFLINFVYVWIMISMRSTTESWTISEEITGIFPHDKVIWGHQPVPTNNSRTDRAAGEQVAQMDLSRQKDAFWPIWLLTWSWPSLTWGQILKFTLLGHHASIWNRLNKRNTMVSESCRYLL